MGLTDILKGFFGSQPEQPKPVQETQTTVAEKPNQNSELSKDDYYANYVREPDREELRQVVGYIAEDLKLIGIDTAIIAVGSSTFSSSYWNRIRECNAKDPHLKIPLEYRDLDLRILPNNMNIEAVALMGAVKEGLESRKYKVKMHETTKMGVRLCKGFSGGVPCIVPFVDFGYGIHSLSTTMDSGTELDIIFGCEGIPVDDRNGAKEEISRQREKGYAFSVLYE